MTAAIVIQDAQAAIARAATLRAIHTAEDHASLRWLTRAREAALWCADNLPTFTGHDVSDRMRDTKTDPIESERNPSAVGPVLLRLKREGLIEKTGERVYSARDNCHRELVVWRKVGT